jgi:hypothetical protein
MGRMADCANSFFHSLMAALRCHAFQIVMASFCPIRGCCFNPLKNPTRHPPHHGHPGQVQKPSKGTVKLILSDIIAILLDIIAILLDIIAILLAIIRILLPIIGILLSVIVILLLIIGILLLIIVILPLVKNILLAIKCILPAVKHILLPIIHILFPKLGNPILQNPTTSG